MRAPPNAQLYFYKGQGVRAAVYNYKAPFCWMELEGLGDQEVKVEGDEIDDIINDFGTINLEEEFNKSDVVFFVVDCYDLLPDHPPDFIKVLDMYINFLKNKIIANPQDKIGLILYGTNITNNNLKFEAINVVNQLHLPTAKIIKDAEKLKDQALSIYKKAARPANLHEVFWVFDNEIKEIDKRKNFVRLFLFTANDNPHALGTHQRKQAIAHARKLADVGVEIELFPLSLSEERRFDIRLFYTETITFDEEQVNSGVLDMSDKIMNLEQRLRQKEFKKRMLNRLLLKIGEDTNIGVKIYALHIKAKKPTGIKVHARTNQPLKRATKILSSTGEELFESDIGYFYPLGGEKVALNKEDMKHLKSLELPGLTLVGFKPQSKLKITHNYRGPYFLYPDEERVTGSSKFTHALIERMTEKGLMGIAKFFSRAGSQVRFVALLPQKQSFNENHVQSPPGFNLIFLPYNDDLMSEDSTRTEYKGTEVSNELVQVTKLLINNLTISNFDLRNFQNPSLQRFYSTLQASALGQKQVQLPRDTLQPNPTALGKCKDILNLIHQTLDMDLGGLVPNQTNVQNSIHSDQQCLDEPKKKKKTKSTKKEKVELKQENNGSQDNENHEVETCLRTGDLSGLTVVMLKNYLKSKSLKTNGKKEELIDRALNYLMN